MVLVIMVPAVTMLTKLHCLCRASRWRAPFPLPESPRNDRSTRRAEAAAPRRSDLASPGVDFLERVGADLLVVHGPVGTRRPADGPASGSVQGQGRGPRWPLAVQDESVWMLREPGDVALVVVHELNDHAHDCGTGEPGTQRTPRSTSTCRNGTGLAARRPLSKASSKLARCSIAA